MIFSTTKDHNLKGITVLIIGFTVFNLILHLLSINRYGIHRDEFLYLALGQHLSFGYMEVPPFIALVARISTTLFGDSTAAIRIIPSLFSAMTTLLSLQMVKTIGGRHFAIAATGCLLCLSPAMLATGYLLQPVIFDQFWWTLILCSLILYFQTGNVKYLLVTGAGAGFGMLTKYAILFLILSILAALLISKKRTVFLKQNTWLAMLIAILIFLPNLTWQYLYNWPVLKHMNELHEEQLTYNTAYGFLAEHLMVHGTLLLVWLPGLLLICFRKSLSTYRWLATSFVALLFILILLKGKAYYAFGIYPVIYAVSAYAVEQSTKMLPKLRYALLLLLSLPNILLIPIGTPILTLSRMVTYLETLDKKYHFDALLYWEDHKKHPLRQDYADMIGWDELLALTKQAYNRIPAQRRKNATIFAENYGEAGAIDHLGKQAGLPPAVSLSSSFTLWAPNSVSYQDLIFIDDKGIIEEIKPLFGTAILVGQISHPYSRELGTKVWLLQAPLADFNSRYQYALKEKRSLHR
ncbi:glycosyltransferase family 39 protein [Arcticibacter sp.]|uniref:glycosyltransferase family 39 protein n=1 Tax=Arcticibacter sp. TaxID=1872630 RepID=UPI00388DE11D